MRKDKLHEKKEIEYTTRQSKCENEYKELSKVAK